MTSSSQSSQNLCLLGATGSIGQSTFKSIALHPHRFKIFSMAIGSQWKHFLPLIEKYQPEEVCVYDVSAARELKQNLPASCQTKVLEGMHGLVELVSHPSIHTVVNGLVGSIGCMPTLKALQLGKRVGLANKETMVMAGNLVNQTLKENPQSSLVPIDSEHSAIFQCIAGRPMDEVSKIILTASGGPFRTKPLEEFRTITIAQALNHPTWNMGPKITIDSASMMNKGLEVIEAHYLFQAPLDKIEILVHPTSTVHSMVQFQDGSLMAQLGSPDMQVPILYSLTFPERWLLQVPHLNLAQLAKLEFFELDRAKFPCVELAYTAGRTGGLLPAVLNGANEVAVAEFLKGTISFLQIPEVIAFVMDSLINIPSPTLEEILEADAWAREQTTLYLNKAQHA